VKKGGGQKTLHFENDISFNIDPADMENKKLNDVSFISNNDIF